MPATIWALLPPFIAIILALLTKEVYISLMVGILSGALLYTGFHPIRSLEVSFEIMGGKIGANVDILIFLVLLGILVALITKSGASVSYGHWASKTIKSPRGALLSTTALGALIFVDDYFNCLTVGTVMRPVTDRQQISRVKLAYIIDATAAPVCIIAPISSWAAAVGSSLPENSGIDGFSLFLKTIPFNFYALLTICFMLFLIITNIDFSRMASFQKEVRAGKNESIDAEAIDASGSGKVMDLILPIAALILSCIGAMLYTGGILNGVGIAQAFANCASARSLVIGSFFTLILTFVLYISRKVLSFQECCDCLIKGFKAMTSALMILSLAWTLSGICSAEYLNIGGFVSQAVNGSNIVGMLLPAAFFLIAAGLAFATGTSWGTFGILIPIALAIQGTDSPAFVIAVSAILAGAVCGDHVSPISDTTILASAGAQCRHIDHVSTQIPYALCVAGCCLAGYLTAGVTGNGWIGLAAASACLVCVLLLIYKLFGEKSDL